MTTININVDLSKPEELVALAQGLKVIADNLTDNPHVAKGADAVWGKFNEARPKTEKIKEIISKTDAFADGPAKAESESTQVSDDTPSGKKQYTEEELKEMPSEDIKDMLSVNYGVDADAYEGKNTNKKVRDLYLAAQAGTLEAPANRETMEDDTPADKKSSVTEAKNEPEDDDTLGNDPDDVTIESIMALVKEKSLTHKDEIKAHFVKYGVPKVSSLDPKDYGKFFAYLNSLD